MTSVNVGEGRDPAKRKVKPVEAQSLLDFDIGEGESSDDSDFRIEDHPEESDDYSINSDDEQKKHGGSDSSDDSDDSDEEENKTKQNSAQEKSLADLLEKAKNKDFKYPGDLANVLICAACLGSRSDDYNEIVECDGCGITVHEGCYGVSDVTSESSTVSSASTEPWFCEACKAGVADPTCELCPNSGGIFKETEVGAWVHLVCALYIPGVAFSDVERLSGVTLFEMAYVRWGARACALCVDAGAARAGVAVGCDAGLCRTFFHVTCGQREGLLAEAHSSEAEQADPFYAHCRLHSDRDVAATRRRAWLALQLRAQRRKQELREKVSAEEKKRIERKLLKHRRKYNQIKENRNPPWVPTQKMARMLYSSASAMRKFQRKAECMGIDTHALEFQATQIAALKDITRRWHVQPAFSVEFVGYYLERNSRVTSLRQSLEQLTKDNERLVAGEEKLRTDYDEASKANTAALAEFTAARDDLQKLFSIITALCPTKTLPSLPEAPVLTLPPPSTPKLTVQHVQNRGMGAGGMGAGGLGAGGLGAGGMGAGGMGAGGMGAGGMSSATPPTGPRPTAAARKQGVGFPLDSLHRGPGLSAPHTDDGTISSRALCLVCGLHGDAHMMAACDTCKNHYHLHCTNPPLQKPPKKTKLYGWQCSECDKSSESEPDVMKEKVPRRSRIRYSKDGAIIAPQSPSSTDITPPQKKSKTTPKTTQNTSPIKVTIKPFEFTSDDDNNEIKKKEKKIRKKIKSNDSDPSSISLKKLKRSFTSPALTNTPLMSITPLIADSPNDSHNENSNQSATVAKTDDQTTFTSMLNDGERDTKTIETSIEATLANLSSDIATYKANRKRRKEKHRSRYSPDFVRSPSKHKHKRKKKQHDLDSSTHVPRITIKIKPIQKPDGSFDKQMFYVPTDNDAGPSQTTPEKVNQSVDTSLPLTPAVALTEPPASSMREGTGRSRGSGAAKTPGALAPLTECDVCNSPGQAANLVRCDECSKRYHLACLEPPLTKNPKKRGYSWHCADCDPTDVEDNAK